MGGNAVDEFKNKMKKGELPSTRQGNINHATQIGRIVAKASTI